MRRRRRGALALPLVLLFVTLSACGAEGADEATATSTAPGAPNTALDSVTSPTEADDTASTDTGATSSPSGDSGAPSDSAVPIRPPSSDASTPPTEPADDPPASGVASLQDATRARLEAAGHPASAAACLTEALFAEYRGAALTDAIDALTSDEDGTPEAALGTLIDACADGSRDQWAPRP
jgi:hypothetical protein